MKSKLVYLNQFSGEKAAVYSIAVENSKRLFINHFIEQYKNDYLEEVLDVMDRLRQIGHYSKIIRTKLNNGSLVLSADGSRFEGNLLLTF
ncbi:hypothetical protein EV199_5217 [Pseudobacter ginsenosidimutans]|uniref:Uncharacterized protein n=1 Tax=Pseudobacter ginsenosidimutans TaxID=661488 RepID=A0A4V2F0B2_9BACT|nr:hypothetical protein EV199_5217 [Pseudobacter ginsenosidimutans]